MAVCALVLFVAYKCETSVQRMNNEYEAALQGVVSKLASQLVSIANEHRELTLRIDQQFIRLGNSTDMVMAKWCHDFAEQRAQNWGPKRALTKYEEACYK